MIRDLEGRSALYGLCKRSLSDHIKYITGRIDGHLSLFIRRYCVVCTVIVHTDRTDTQFRQIAPRPKPSRQKHLTSTTARHNKTKPHAERPMPNAKPKAHGTRKPLITTQHHSSGTLFTPARGRSCTCAPVHMSRCARHRARSSK